MQKDELLAQVKAHINDAVERAIASQSVTPDLLFLYMAVQILDRVEQMHERLICIEGNTDSLSSSLLEDQWNREHNPLTGR